VIPWVAIIDHSIDIGTKKARVVLRVKIDTLSKRGQAIHLEDCECIEIKKQMTSRFLLVSSDIIESLFGNFKHIIERSPQADMNSTTLIILALCGNIDEATITQALRQANHGDLKD